MSQIIILENNLKISQKLCPVLIKKYGHEVIVKDSVYDVISFLEIINLTDLVIINGQEQVEKGLYRLLKFIRGNSEAFANKMKILIVGEVNVIAENVILMGTESSVEAIIHNSLYLLGHEDREFKEFLKESIIDHGFDKSISFNSLKYAPLKVNWLLFDRQLLPANIFIKIKKNNKYEYFLKYKANEICEVNEIKHNLDHGIEHYYVLIEDKIKTLEYFISILGKQLLNSELSIDQRINLNNHGFEILLDIFSKENDIKLSRELSKLLLVNTEFILKFNDNVHKIIDKFRENHFKYYGSYHYLVTLFLYNIMLDQFEWGSTVSRNRAIYLGLFHDVSIGSNKLIRLHHENRQLVHIEFGHSDKEIILNHADLSAKNLELLFQLPKDIVMLIREHHGSFSGQGFSEQINNKISNGMKLFILSESLATEILAMSEIDSNFNFFKDKHTMNKIIEDLKNKFSKNGYLDLIITIQRLFL